MIDRVSYADTDRASTIDYYDYRTVDGALVAMRQIGSDGDHTYDVTQTTKSVRVDAPVSANVFAVPPSPQVQTDAPLTVHITRRRGAWYVPVEFHGHSYEFLLDSGSQGTVIDAHVAAENLLVPEGKMEIAGARRTSGIGVAAVDAFHIGGALLPVRVATVLDLAAMTGGLFHIDGILGYPFFAEAEIRIDPDRATMTLARPGTLPVVGERLAVDLDRELPELPARADGEEGRFLVDTGDGNEVLLFHRFVDAHPGLLSAANSSRISSFGVGGSMNAAATNLNELDIGSYRLFNRKANVLYADTGAFADQFLAGNVGLPTLDNFIVTFDLANEALYLAPGPHFDDGRYRPIYQ